MQSPREENNNSTTTSEPAKYDFLSELKTQYERELELRTTLDTKANNMITMSGTVTTILIAIGTLLVSRIESNLSASIGGIIFLSSGIIFATIAIRYFIRSYLLRSYRYAIGSEAFFDENTQDYKENVTKQFMTLEKDKFHKHIAKEYLLSIKENAEANKAKSEEIKKGQNFLHLSVISISILVVFVLFVLYVLAFITSS